jgi:hypothetical protein
MLVKGQGHLFSNFIFPSELNECGMGLKLLSSASDNEVEVDVYLDYFDYVLQPYNSKFSGSFVTTHQSSGRQSYKNLIIILV